MTDSIVVLCTCASLEEANRLANEIVEYRLAACVNITGPIQSVYRWQDAVERSQEILLLIKTTTQRFPVLRDRISELHSYDTPEIIALPIVAGSEKYLGWIKDQL
jgi:periplasmic divalent cation tolerance protein